MDRSETVRDREARSRGRRLTNLSSQPKALFGRGVLLREIEGALSACRALLLRGPGGIGKSHLALHIARRALEGASFAEAGAYVCELSGHATPVSALSLIANACGLSAAPDLGAALSVRGPTLLVLDDPEPGACDVIASLLDAAPNVRALVTSRAALAFCDRSIEVGPLRGAASEALFLARGSQMLLHASARESFAAIADRAIAATGGHPLTIEICASACALAAARRDASYESIVTDALCGALLWTWSLLSREEQTIVAVIAAWRAPVHPDWVRLGANAPSPRDKIVAALNTLAGRGLIEPRERGCYAIHDRVRAFVREQTEESSIGRDAALARRRGVVEAWRHAESIIPGPYAERGADILRWIHADSVDLFEQAVERGDEEGVAHFGAARILASPYALEPAGVLRRVAVLVWGAGQGDERLRDQRCAAALWSAFFVNQSAPGGPDFLPDRRVCSEQKWLDRARDLLPPGPSALRVTYNVYRAYLAGRQGRPESESIGFLDRAALHARDIRGGVHEARVLSARFMTIFAASYRDLDDPDALDRLDLIARKAREAAARSGDQRTLCGALLDQSIIALASARYDETREYAREALSLPEDARARLAVQLERVIAAALYLSGDPLGALAHAERSVEEMNLSGLQGGRNMSLFVAGLCCLELERSDHPLARQYVATVSEPSAREEGALEADYLLVASLLAREELLADDLRRAGVRAVRAAPYGAQPFVEPMIELFEAAWIARRGAETPGADLRGLVHRLDQMTRPRPAYLARSLVTLLLRFGRQNARERDRAIWRADARGLWFETPSADRVDLGRRAAARRALAALLAAHRDEPGRALTTDEFFEAGWPDELATHDASRARVYTLVRRMRELGLRELLVNSGDGYLLEPDAAIEIEGA